MSTHHSDADGTTEPARPSAAFGSFSDYQNEIYLAGLLEGRPPELPTDHCGDERTGRDGLNQVRGLILGEDQAPDLLCAVTARTGSPGLVR